MSFGLKEITAFLKEKAPEVLEVLQKVAGGLEGVGDLNETLKGLHVELVKIYGFMSLIKDPVAKYIQDNPQVLQDLVMSFMKSRSSNTEDTENGNG